MNMGTLNLVAETQMPPIGDKQIGMKDMVEMMAKSSWKNHIHFESRTWNDINQEK